VVSNDDLYTVNSELLDLLAGAEHVTVLARVRTENVVEDYCDRLNNLDMRISLN